MYAIASGLKGGGGGGGFFIAFLLFSMIHVVVGSRVFDPVHRPLQFLLEKVFNGRLFFGLASQFVHCIFRRH